MFERIKKAFSKDTKESEAPASQAADNAVSEWAGTQGFAFTGVGNGFSFALQGKVGNKPWRMERGRPTRAFVRGEELRARAELGLDEDICVLIMNRPLKEALEKQAYSSYTDSLRTTADPNLPEELRWLSMYEEVGWDSLPREFWGRYAVHADERDRALAWIDSSLAELLLSWPEPGPTAEVPFIMMILRGKAYLRMEYTPASLPVLQHAAQVFTSACEAALGGLSTDLPL